MTVQDSPRSITELNFTPRMSVHPSPGDWRDQFIYFLIVDRFDDGKNRRAYDYRPGTPQTDPKQGIGFQGGNLKGLTRRLRYIKDLGATAVWLTPVLKNRLDDTNAYHGYATQNFLEIDPRMGTKEDLIDLVKSAHALDLYVILDIVINHTGDNWGYENDTHPLYRHDGTQYPFGFWRSKNPPDAFDPDDAVWPAELQSLDCYKRRGGIVDWNNMEESLNGDFLNLKELDLGNPIVLETMQAVYKYWIAIADIDGYRIDTVKHVEDGAAAAFCNAIKEYAVSIGKKNFFLYGEIVSDDATLRRYVGTKTHGDEKIYALDACLDFPLYFILEEVIKAQANPQVLRERYDRLRQLYPDTDASEFFVTFLDNHDQMARPYRRFLHGVSDKRQAILGIGYLLTTLGIPSIYYGTEQGFDGGAPFGPFNDAFIRECMFGGNWGAFGTTGVHFFNKEHPLYVAIAHVAAVRRQEPGLRYGRQYFREVSEDGSLFRLPALGWGMLAYSRILDETELVIVLNLRSEPYTNYITVDWNITPPGTLMGDLLNITQEALAEEHANRSVIRVTVPPYGFSIYKKKVE